ncbi:MAG: AzlC family ABC transporter permease [Lachnospiraceae bacterium]|nr:AzlC family ABC transporter permease [Lachnospiraceae bacterium]
MDRRMNFAAGIRDGIPICLGYIAVSFTFGIMCKNAGISTWQAVLISASNLTSAGQFAGLSLIASAASYVEMAFTQFIINLRYCLMSCALSQKLDTKSPFFHRFFISYGVTDEIFGVSIGRSGKLSPWYSYGCILVSAFGWVFGTFLGIVSGNVLPARAISALSVALYGMFIAVIVPPARVNKIIAGIVIISMVCSLIFQYAPLLSRISSGFRIIILTILIAGAAAYFFPVKDKEDSNES